ncbi:MAG: ShlB/FhaC/HecB family hemolysin secretion/activation protein [Symploca sp. SIO2E6]|nr:ShlB/FhaC/HecB family hemolysin secretion/activation protein [Symploca sp. SIO2E6]
MLRLKSMILGFSASLPSAILFAHLGSTNGLAAVPAAIPEAGETIEAATQRSEQLAQQADPNRERFVQPIPELEPLPPESTETEPVLNPPPQESPTDSQEAGPSEVMIPVRKIEVIGSTVFTLEQFTPFTEPFEGRSVSLRDLQSVTDAIDQLYLDAGYITSSAVLADQEIIDGVVKIQVIEGRLSEIQVEGTQRLNPNYIKDRIGLGVTTPLRVDMIEDQLRLLRADPLLENIESSLRSGSQLGESILIVRVQEAKAFSANFSIDNSSPPSVGSERFGVSLGYLNLSGIGDDLAASYYRSTTGGSNIVDLSYRVPLNPMNGTLQLRTVIDRNRITDPQFDELGITGESELYEVSFRQPLIRTPLEEFALSVGFSYKDGQTFVFDNIPQPFSIGAEADGVTRTSVLRFGQDYIRRDPQGAWSGRSQFSFGTGLFDATTNPSPIPDGNFVSWLGQVQRVQGLDENNLLLMSLDVQLTPDSLLPSEQFVIGGGQSLRGYRQNARSGDNGLRFSIEDRITLQRDEGGIPMFQLVPFVDLGKVWHDPDNPDSLPRQTFLFSAGLGLLWEPTPGLNIRFGYGYPFIDLDDRGTNAQDEGFFFGVNLELF